MIEFKPIIESDKPESKNDDGIFSYVALEDGKTEVGMCFSRLEGYNMNIISVKANDSDSFIIEGLIRSALNFGANRGAYIAKITDNSVSTIAETLGFKNIDGILTGEIPDLLTGHCCADKKH